MASKEARSQMPDAPWVKTGDVEDTMTYHAAVLTTWGAFRTGLQTVWSRWQIWRMMARLAGISAVVAVVSAWLVPDPQALSVSRFTDISLFLRVFVGLLLSFFLSSSMNRWYNCCSGFLELFDAIRNLQMQFIALGAMTQERAALCIRYGVLSAHLLDMELHSEALHGEERTRSVEGMWSKIAAPPGTPRRDNNNDVAHCGRCYDGEVEVLQQVDDPASLVWIWVASLVGRMAQDGEIPAMQTPTYGRIMNLAQEAHGGIRRVRGSISVQAPYIYVHMLATLVHINNILNAIAFGFILGTSAGVWMAHNNVHPGRDVPASGNDTERDFQDVLVAFFFCVFGPFLYQALLETAMIVARPFGDEAAQIPTQRMMARLAIDLRDGLMMSGETQFWERPVFKE